MKKNTEFKWEYAQEAALKQIKNKLTQATVLQYYNVKEPVITSVHNSMSGTDAVLLQKNLPDTYASKCLTDAQKRYSKLEKEMFAVCFGLSRFHDCVYGKQDVIVETDHLPLLGVFKKTFKSMS